MGRASVELSKVRRVLTQHNHMCGACAEEFDPNECIFLIQIVRPYRFLNDETRQWEIHFEKQLDESGDFENPPYFFHQDCWAENSEELLESMYESVGGEEHVEHVEGEICRCSFCSGYICEGDLMGVVHLGEFVLSERQPNGDDAIDTPLDPKDPTYLCLCCLNELNLNIIPDLWSSDSEVAQVGR